MQQLLSQSRSGNAVNVTAKESNNACEQFEAAGFVFLEFLQRIAFQKSWKFWK